MAESEGSRVRREGHERRTRHDKEDADYAADMQKLREEAARQAEKEGQ